MLTTSIATSSDLSSHTSVLNNSEIISIVSIICSILTALFSVIYNTKKQKQTQTESNRVKEEEKKEQEERDRLSVKPFIDIEKISFVPDTLKVNIELHLKNRGEGSAYNFSVFNEEITVNRKERYFYFYNNDNLNKIYKINEINHITLTPFELFNLSTITKYPAYACTDLKLEYRDIRGRLYNQYIQFRIEITPDKDGYLKYKCIDKFVTDPMYLKEL